MARTKIEWTETSWNPVTGCSKISPGCKNCYAERMSLRLQAMGQPHYKNGFQVSLHEDILDKPLSWKKPQMIFVNSMSDLFHENIPDEFIFQVFNTMRKAHWHIFQILTKRAERLLELNDKIQWIQNIWSGVSVENYEYVNRIDRLRLTKSKMKFISFEPLLDDIKELDLSGIDWVIVGGESGPFARPMKKEWVESIQLECQKQAAPFFFKQWGGKNKKKSGRELNGRIYSQYPDYHHQDRLAIQ